MKVSPALRALPVINRPPRNDVSRPLRLLPPVKAARLVVEQLLALGVSWGSGIPGGPAAAAFQAFGENLHRMQMVLTRHEATAGHAADFYYRVRRELAVVAVTAGPGLTNLRTALHSAKADGSALFVVAAATARRDRGKSCAQALELKRELKPATKAFAVLKHPSDGPRLVRKLARRALTGVPGPVVLVVPVDVGVMPVVGGERLIKPPAPLPRPCSPSDAAAVERAAQLLLSARAPVIVAGYGAVLARAADALRRLADRLGCRFATSGRAKGLLPDPPFHPNACGVLGLGGRPEAEAAVAAADVILLVGEQLGDLTSSGFSDTFLGKRLIQIDVRRAAIGRHYPVEVGIAGDAARAVQALLASIERRAPQRRPVAAPTATPLQSLPSLVARMGRRRLTPRRVMQVLTHLIPRQAHVVADIGAAAMCWSLHELRRSEPYRFHLSQKMGAMGSAVAGVLGAAAATDGDVVLLTGDAAFEQTMGAELRTALHSGIRYVAVVMVDGGNGMVEEGFEGLGGTYPPTMYPTPAPVAKIARILGAAGFAVNTARQLVDVFPRALAAARPAVIEVRIQRDPRDPTPMGSRIKQFQA